MPEDTLQRWITETFRPLAERWILSRRRVAFVGADQFIYWRQYDATRRLAPDIYVLPGVEPGRRVKSWKTWETGIVPSFALEIVSDDVDKDYVDVPPKYGELGVRELVLFDPDDSRAPDRFRFQVYRRVARHGLVRVEATNGDRVKSKELGGFLRSVGVDAATRLRIATGAAGDELYPTIEEIAERERAAHASERSLRLAAEAEVARLRDQLAGGGKRRTKRR